MKYQLLFRLPAFIFIFLVSVCLQAQVINSVLDLKSPAERGAATGVRSKGSFAWGGYYGTTYWADPEKNMVCFIMTQHTPDSHGDLAKKFEILVYSAIK